MIYFQLKNNFERRTVPFNKNFRPIYKKTAAIISSKGEFSAANDEIIAAVFIYRFV